MGRWLRRFVDFPVKHPVVFGGAVSAAKTSASDYSAQKFVEKKEQIDVRRNLVFFCWGLLWLGGVQYFIYVKVFAKHLFPGAAAFAAKPLREKIADRAGQAAVLKQVSLDQFVHHPFMLFPAFYQVKELIEGGTPSDAWRKFRANQYEDLKTCWSIWIPAFIFNFSFCPLWMRVPFVAGVSFFFMVLFSSMRGAPEQTPDKISTD